MSRITKWKIEKTKVKVVFRLQFHATHIPQSGWDKLFISFIPSDSGKATSKITKANVRNGTCKWADPIYETTRLLQDIKTRQYDEKLYKLVVGMGSSRSSILGEANINLADFVEALTPTAVALPLNGCEAGSTLHVTVQLLTSKTGFREFEQQRELRERGLPTTSDQGTHNESADSKESSPDQNVNNHINKASARVKLKKDSKEHLCVSSHEREAGLNEEYPDSPVGLDGSSNTSENIYAEKHNMSSTHEVDSLKSTTSGDLGGSSLSQSPQPEKGDASDPSRSSDWVQGWTVDYSAANDMVAASEDNNRLKGNLEAIESSILDLKLEMCSLQNHADEIDVETNKFSEHLAAEISSGEALAKEVAILKSECSKFKEDFEQLKSSKLSSAYATREPTETDQYKFFQKLPPKWLKGLLLMEDRLRGLQKKVSMGYHERNSRFLNSELEALVEVLQDLKQESAEEISGTNIANGGESQEMASHKGDPFLAGTGSESDLFPPEGMVPYISIPGLESHESDSIDPSLEMKGKFFELLRELDESKTERESLARKMDQMECYYEALVQELEQNQRQMMGELQNLRNEHSTCLYTISSSKTEMDRMHQNMKEQIIKFDEDKRILSSLNSDLEKRAVSAEAALKRARLNYSIAVGQLQKDLELLSCQVLSMYETNENLIKQAFSDSSLPSPDSCPETLKQLKNSEEGLTSNQFFCQNQNAALNKQHFGEDTLLKDLKQSLHLQEGLYKQVEEEVFHMHFVNIYLEVFSKALQETLLEASVDIRLMKEDIDRLSQQLQLSTESKDVLMLRLQNAMNDIHSLNEYKVSCTVRSNDIAHQNEILEANFKSLAHENHLLTQKIIDLEAHLTEYRSYESKYVACNAENLELKNFLKKESLVNDHLHDEISILQEELKAIRTEFDELASMKDNLQNVVSFLCNKLQKLIASYENKYSKLSLCSTSVCQDLESNKLEGLLLQLEEFQQSACDRILQLIEEKKVLVNEQNMTQVSLNTAKSDCVVMKQKFEHNLQEMVSNLSVSSALLQRLQLEFEMVVNTLKVGSDAEEIYSLHQKELLSDLVHLEAELQQLNMKNQDLAQEIFRLDNLSGDLEICKLSLAAITGEKETLEMSLQMKTKESAKISSEIIFLKESLHSLHDELHVERTFREKLENTVTDLTSELNEKQCQLKDFESNKKELVQLKQMITDLESEKSRVSQLLLETDKRLEDVLRESSSINCLESQLSELHDFSIATDVIMIFTRAQFGGHIEELVEKLHSTCWQLEVFHKKNLDVEAELQQLKTRNQDLAREIFRLDTVSGDLEICKLSLAEITEEKEALEVYLQAKAEESAKISSELNFLKESMHALHDELHAERTLKGKLENTVTDLTSELNEKQCQLKDFESSKKELIQLKKMIRDLESEKSRVSQLLLETDERLKDVLRESSSISCLETQLSELHDFSVATDVIMIFTRAQFGGHMEELVEKLHSTCRQLEVLHKKNVDVESELNGFLSRESTYVEENARLLISLDFLKSELEASTAQRRALVDQNSAIIAELKEYKSKAENVNDIPCEHKSQCALEVARLENLLASCSREIEDLFFAKEELEVKCIVFLSELDELKTAMGLLNQSNDELRRLQNQCNELTKRLSEQVLKTEEFKNLSIHLKELKDKADAECLNSRERKGHEVQPVAMQESLRIAFIKEQYETKLQELKQQLSLSKKHSEEMLWKLQDAVDDIENRKKSEASLIKRNEELVMKILNLEAELQAVLSEKRNLLNAYDLVKAEKECSIISLECCKQEKQELESSLLKCNEEKSKIAIELTLTKELAENSGSRLDVLNEGNEVLHTMTCPSDEPIEEKLHARDSIFDLPTVGSDIVDKVPRNHSSVDPFSNSLNPKEVKATYAACSQEPESSLIPFNMQPEDGLAFRGMSGYQTLGTEENLQLSEQKHVALCENLKSSLDHLNEELERMKNENLLPPVDNHNFEPSFPGLQRELMQLNEANQELGNIFPVFNEICVSGNALERVLALEIELAEALQAKKKSSMQFQSSFVKQHRDEEAIFRSFRDINELIKEMLELKERQVAVETELKEMHDRYSQLSLHFAEVEGERQKLMMTLKNTRAPNRALHSTTSFGDHSL